MMYFEHLKQLHDCELYADLKQMSSFVQTLCKNSDLEVLSLPQRYQSLVYYGNALYHLAEYSSAEGIYKDALLIRKVINKAKGKIAQPMPIQMELLTSDVEVKYKIYQCLNHLRKAKEALSVLEGISTKERNAKINMALAKLYLKSGMDRSAITSYKEVLRECPMSLGAIHGLISIGQKGPDVIALVLGSLPHGTSCDWLSSWVQGHGYCSTKEYTKAITTFTILNTTSLLKTNIYVKASLARAYFLEGLYERARMLFEQTHLMDQTHLQHMELYAFLLAKEKKVEDLDHLATVLMTVTEQSPEPWIAMGYLSIVNKKPVRAVYFGQKANSIDPSYVESFLLKGLALLEVKKRKEAIFHFRTALHLWPHRFEIYSGLVQCYLATGVTPNREALLCANNALKTLGTNSRTLTLYGSVLALDPTNVTKAKPYLEKAMKLNPSNLDPVLLLLEILYQEKQFEKGIEILRNRMKSHTDSRLFQVMGDFLTQVNDLAGAVENYNSALHLDPHNKQARQGMDRIDKGDLGMDNAFEVEVEETSENDIDYDASDHEGNWSETDFS